MYLASKSLLPTVIAQYLHVATPGQINARHAIAAPVTTNRAIEVCLQHSEACELF